MGLLSSGKIRREQLKPGDHIYTWRRGYSYSHHGIYVGEGKVIHLTRAPGLIVFTSSPSGEDRVVCCSVEEFLCGGDLYLYEYGVNEARLLIKRGGTCSLASSDPPEDVLHRASILLETGFGDYDLFQNNCEDLAIYCKTGSLPVDMSSPGRSGQIKFLCGFFCAVDFIPNRFLPANFFCLALVLYVLSCVFKLANGDDEKVGVEKIQDFSYRSGGRSAVLRIEKGAGNSTSTRWFLPPEEYAVNALLVLRYWSWTPTSPIFSWIRLFALHCCLYAFLSQHLRNHGLKPREYTAYIIWLLGYWYWSSEMSTIFKWTKLLCLQNFLVSLMSDDAREEKLQTCVGYTILVLVLWDWTPRSTILMWTRFVSLYAFVFLFVSYLTDYPPKLGRCFFACFATYSAAVLFWGIGFKRFVFL